MRELKQVLGWNMVVLVVYSAVFFIALLLKLTDELSLGFLMMVSVALHASTCFLASFVFFFIGKAEYASAFLLTTLVAGLVGFSVCFGGAYVMG
ncbi:MAG: hypothetical protein IPN95_07980 [Bacteroidetes bacterium]|nr:hypothetical protein [Bacteroidota bacterium]MBL0019657.1 hypothetical protein [Bacteroidota bacterium]